MRALLALTVIMGVLILVGTGVVAVTILHRMGGGTPHSLANSVLDEPAGTRIVGVSALGNRLAIVLQGGGPDRIVLVDPSNGQYSGKVALAR